MTTTGGQQIEPTSLQDDLDAVRTDISTAQEKNAKLAGGFVKALVEARIEILKTTEALLEQRLHAVQSKEPITVQVPTTKRDEDRARELETEIIARQRELFEARAEAAKYSGGLVATMKSATVATIEQTLAMLEQEYLRSKYGLAIPSIREDQFSSAQMSTSTRDSSAGAVKTPARQIVVPAVSRKRFAKENYEDYIWFDVEWKAVNLRKAARSIKGFLLFHDLFGEQKLAVRVTIDDPIAPGRSRVQRGIGFDYNQFRDEHRWVRTTELNDMLIQFEIESILYSDGEREDF